MHNNYDLKSKTCLSISVTYNAWKDVFLPIPICLSVNSYPWILQSHKLPQRVLNGEWNCSVDYWGDFRGHLLCNLQTQCAGGEDEQDCGYTTCTHGGFWLHGVCYVITQPENDITFIQAYDICRQINGRPPSFALEQKRKQFVDFVLPKSKLAMYVDVRSITSDMLRM